MDAIRILYITSPGHSGSTLLDLLISGHSQVVSVGEVKQLTKGIHRRCACGAEELLRCELWSRVNKRLVSSLGCGLGELDIGATDQGRFEADNVALFKAVKDISGCAVILDSSKDLVRLDRLRKCKSMEVVPILLRRHIGGQVYSQIKKDRRWYEYAVKIFRNTANRILYLQNDYYIEVTYDELCKHTEKVLQDIVSKVMLRFEPDQLRWREGVRHNVGGNAMIRRKDDAIELDNAWRIELKIHQRVVVRVLNSLLNSKKAMSLIKYGRPYR